MKITKIIFKIPTNRILYFVCIQGYIFWPFLHLKEDFKKGRKKGGKEEKRKRVIKYALNTFMKLK